MNKKRQKNNPDITDRNLEKENKIFFIVFGINIFDITGHCFWNAEKMCRPKM